MKRQPSEPSRNLTMNAQQLDEERNFPRPNNMCFVLSRYLIRDADDILGSFGQIDPWINTPR